LTVVATRPVQRRSRHFRLYAIVGVMLLVQAAASAPTPLYVVYQRLWRFSAATTTLIFAIFVIGLLVALLVFGELSDYVGRRPVLLTALAIEAGAILLFIMADGVAMLLVARALQGIATGIALPALGAALVDADPQRARTINGVAPIGGLAIGSLVCGAFAQYGPDPTHLIWQVLLGAIGVAFVVVMVLPASTTRRRPPARILIPRIAIPHRLRRDVFALIPIIVASWALGGLYLSLGPSTAAVVFGIGNHFLGGLVATLLCGTGAVVAYAVRRTGNARRIAIIPLLVGTAVTLIGIRGDSIVLAIAGTIVAGIGYGASGLATLGALAKLAGPADKAERGALFAAAYSVAYLAFSVPAVAAGIAANHIGLSDTVTAYSVLVIAITLAACARPSGGRSVR
jgi:MFS family permease